MSIQSPRKSLIIMLPVWIGILCVLAAMSYGICYLIDINAIEEKLAETAIKGYLRGENVCCAEIPIEKKYIRYNNLLSPATITIKSKYSICFIADPSGKMTNTGMEKDFLSVRTKASVPLTCQVKRISYQEIPDCSILDSLEPHEFEKAREAEKKAWEKEKQVYIDANKTKAQKELCDILSQKINNSGKIHMLRFVAEPAN